MERKQLTGLQFRGTGTERTIAGYGSVWNTVDSYGDTIAKGAFANTLREWKAKGKLPKMLLQHGGGGLFGGNADDMVPIGKWDEMREDDHGLYVRGHLFDVDTPRQHSIYAAMKAGELDGLSIGFQTKKSSLDEQTGIRTITEIALWEVSAVLFPANDPARITEVRGRGDHLASVLTRMDASIARLQRSATMATRAQHEDNQTRFAASVDRVVASQQRLNAFIAEQRANEEARNRAWWFAHGDVYRA